MLEEIIINRLLPFCRLKILNTSLSSLQHVRCLLALKGWVFWSATQEVAASWVHAVCGKLKAVPSMNTKGRYTTYKTMCRGQFCIFTEAVTDLFHHICHCLSFAYLKSFSKTEGGGWWITVTPVGVCIEVSERLGWERWEFFMNVWGEK